MLNASPIKLDPLKALPGKLNLDLRSFPRGPPAAGLPGTLKHVGPFSPVPGKMVPGKTQVTSPRRSGRASMELYRQIDV